jgi:hypothetical protein
MCNPMALGLLTLAISGATTGYSLYQQNQAAEDAADAAGKSAQYLDEAEMNQLKALEEQMAQVKDQGELEKLERQRQAIRERAKIRVASAESGAMGNSVFRSTAASMLNESMDKGVIDANVANQASQIKSQMESVKINTKRMKNDLYSGGGVNPFFAGLSIAGSGIQGFGQGYGLGQDVFPE